MVHFKYLELPTILEKYLSTICFGRKLGRDKKIIKGGKMLCGCEVVDGGG